MTEYIDRDKLLPLVEDVSAYYDEGKQVKREIIEIIKDEPAADRWIPVTERWPEEGVSVLVSYISLISDGVTVATYDSDHEGWYWDDHFDAIAAVVIAWRPLPEPYKGGLDGHSV